MMQEQLHKCIYALPNNMLNAFLQHTFHTTYSNVIVSHAQVLLINVYVSAVPVLYYAIPNQKYFEQNYIHAYTFMMSTALRDAHYTFN